MTRQLDGRWLVALTASTIVFDGIDIQLLSVVTPTMMGEWQQPRSAFAPVVSLAYLGMMIGAAGAGMAGDRIGRRRALLLSVGLFGATTLAIATVRDIPTLAVLRFIAGLGLGGALPNAATLASEFVPPAQRPMAVTATIVCVPIGGMMAGLLGGQFLDVVGWRALFVVGGVLPLLAVVVLWRLLPESPGFHAEHRPRAPVSSLFQAEFRRDTIALWAAFCSCLLAVYLGFSWLPTLLAGAGFATSTASHGITAFNLGGVVGGLTIGAIMHRIGSRITMLAMTAGAIGGAVTLSMMEITPKASLAPIMIMLTITGGLITSIQTTMYALATNVYPSAARATGVGAATGFGRSGAIISGYAGPWAIGLAGSEAYFLLIAGTMTVCFVALASVSRHVPRSSHRA